MSTNKEKKKGKNFQPVLEESIVRRAIDTANSDDVIGKIVHKPLRKDFVKQDLQKRGKKIIN